MTRAKGEEMRRGWKGVLILLTIGLIVLGANGLYAPPADAHACVEVRIWQGGNSTPVGDCVSVFDEWGHLSPGGDHTVNGNGVGFTVSVPRPV